MTIRYKGPHYSISGYGVSVRELVKALRLCDVNVIESSEDSTPYEIVVHHMSVNALPNSYEPGKINIVYTMFEADRFPEAWVNILNQYEIPAVIVPTEYSATALKNSGYKGHLFVVPIPVEDELFYVEEIDESIVFPELDNPDEYKFYSIMQLSERKNLRGLLTAYVTEFSRNEKVRLFIKFYGTARDEGIKKVREIITNINVKDIPAISLFFDEVDKPALIEIHKRCDCYVSLHRSEGFGLPIAEALYVGNKAVVTGYSGNMDFCDEDDDSVQLIKHMLTPVYGQIDAPIWKEAYNGNMLWAEPDIIHAKEQMRNTFKVGKQEKVFNEGVRDYLSINNAGLAYKMILQEIMNMKELVA